MTDYLNDIRLIVWNEKESGKLTDIPADLFKNGKKNLEEIQAHIHGCADPLSEEAAELLDQYHSTSETLNTIIKLRLKKILKLAEAQIEERYYDREEMKLMLLPEKAMFEAVCREIGVCRDTLLGEPEGEVPEGEIPATTGIDETGPLIESEDDAVLFEDEIAPSPTPAAAEEKTAEDIAVVLVKQDVPTFMGLDDLTYTLNKEDIVTLPKGNAAVLCERNIALNIRLIK